MNSINSSNRECDDPDRLIECQQAIEFRFLELVPPGLFSARHDEAVAAGWSTAALSAELGDEI